MENSESTPPLLAGIRVLELASYIMAPSAATILSDFGAEVIKVEPPTKGDENRYLHQLPGMPITEIPFCFLQDNRNKKSIALNLKSEAGQKIINQLIQTADIFITNFRPPALKKLHLTYEELQALNPKLIYAYASAFGEKGAEAEKGGYDMISYWARSGIESAILPPHDWTHRFPTGSGDHPSGVSLFSVIILALFARDRTGRGYKVSTSLLANGAWANASFIQAQLCGAQFREKRPRQNAYNFASLAYQTQDQKLLKLTIVDTQRIWPQLCEVINRPHLIDDPKFATDAARQTNMSELITMFDQAFAEADLETWVKLLHKHDITHSPIAEIQEVAQDEQMKANGVFVEIDHPRYGPVTSVNSPIEVAESKKVSPQAAPAVGQHSQEILKELGYPVQDIQAFLKQGIIIQETL